MNTINAINFQSNSQKKVREKKNIKGGAIALLTNGVIGAAAALPTKFYVDNLVKPSRALTQDQIELANKGIKEVVENITNLSEKGVKVIDIKDIPTQNKADAFAQIKNGKNACFIPPIPKTLQQIYETKGIKANSVVVNPEKLPLAAFHELGHAFNCNNSVFWKSIQKARSPLIILSAIISVIPAFTKEIKPKNGQELTKKEKFNNGLRKASPLIAAATFLPIIAEEAMATIRGNNWAKQVFDKDLAKKVAKTNKWGLASYITMATFTGLASFAAKKVKDHFDDKKTQKEQTRQLVK